MSKEQNRALMPKVAEFIDAVRAEFGEVKVSYASENGIARGTPWPVEDELSAEWALGRAQQEAA